VGLRCPRSREPRTCPPARSQISFLLIILRAPNGVPCPLRARARPRENHNFGLGAQALAPASDVPGMSLSEEARMTRAGGLKTLLRDRTVQLFALVLLPILGGLVWHIARLQRQLTAELSLADASAYSDTFHEFRSLYTTEVVDRARAAGLKVTHDYKDHDRAIPLPATFTILLGERIGQHQGGGQVRLYSDYPFPWRKDGGAHDEFERQALARLRRHPEQPVSSYEQLNGRRALRYATAERMAERCVGCHNSLADSPKRDWKVGDVRGVLEVIRPLDSVAAHTTGALIETGIIGAIAVIAL